MSMLAVALVLAAQQAGSPPAARRPITETDLFRFVWIADPQISPDGGRVAFVRVTVNKKKDGYDTALWIVPADGSAPPRPFTSGPRDIAPRWSPDGRRLAFLRAAEKDGKPQPPQIHLMRARRRRGAGAHRPAQGRERAEWSPDGSTLAFTSTTNAKDLEKARAKEAGAPTGRPSARATCASSRAPSTASTAGLRRPARPSHVWTVAVPPAADAAPPPRQVTSGEFEEDDPAWSRRRRAALLHFEPRRTSRTTRRPTATSSRCRRGGGAPALVAEHRRADRRTPRRRRTAGASRSAARSTASPLRSYDQPDLFVVDVPGAPPAQPHRGLRLRRRRRARPATSARRAAGGRRAPSCGRRRPQSARRRRASGAGRTCVRVDARDGPAARRDRAATRR